MPPPKSAGWLGSCALAADGCWIHTMRVGNPALLSGLTGASEFLCLHICLLLPQISLSAYPFQLPFPFQLFLSLDLSSTSWPSL